MRFAQGNKVILEYDVNALDGITDEPGSATFSLKDSDGEYVIQAQTASVATTIMSYTLTGEEGGGTDVVGTFLAVFTATYENTETRTYYLPLEIAEETYERVSARTIIRSRAGNVGQIECTPSQADYAIDAAQRKVSKLKPLLTMAYITTIANIQAYALPSDCLTVKECYWNGSDSFQFSEDITLAIDDIIGESATSSLGISLYENPSIKTVIDSKTERFIEQYGGGWDIWDDQLRLRPCPTTAGIRVYYLYTKLETLETIMKKYAEPFYNFAVAAALRMVAIRRGKISSVSGAGESISYEKSQELISTAKDLENEATLNLGPQSFFVVG